MEPEHHQRLKPGESREQILRAAEELFGANGYAHTTLKDISRSSGSNGALVSYYFGSKEGLRNAVVERKLSRMRAILEPVLEQEAVNPEDLRKMFRAILKHVREDEAFHRMAIRSLLDDASFAEMMRKNLWQPVFEKFCEVIDRATKQKLSRADIETRCVALVGIISHYAKLRCFHARQTKTSLGHELILERYEDFAAEALIGAICGTAGGSA